MTPKIIAVETPNGSVPFVVSSGPSNLQEGVIMRSGDGARPCMATVNIQLGTGFGGARRPLVVLDTRHSSGTRDYWWPRVRSRLNAALINARCVKACGKLPRASPCELVCSA